ncbi:site-specific integrase [Oceanivirga miroungae]|uniref:Integrase family protein n=1 Tax=Oceanivirga miroungae TaxID=1130046 RepID=A0A6I8MAN9_9FUSO|nr:site-specific integrase [Oceanivirga miroungae]VWL85842.1 integrase family protein [Oceanivirga miroungae]
MPIYKYKNSKGDTLYRVVYLVNTPKGSKWTSKMDLRTLKEAKLFEANEIAKKDYTADMFLSDIIVEFLKDRKIRVQESTYRRYTHYCNSILKIFGDKKLKDYSYQYFHKLLTNIGKESHKRVNSNIKVLKQINKFAYRCFEIQNKNITRLEYFKNVRVDKEYNIWTLEEFNTFVDVIPDKFINYKIYFSILFYGGLRRGEALALQVKDISRYKINVDKNLGQRDHLISTPKTRNSIRVITMPKDLINTILAFIDKQQLTENNFLFSFSYSNVVNCLRKYTKMCNLPKITPHDLRHSHASILFENNMPTAAISKRLGHSNISITLDVYTHLTKKSNDKLNSFILEL